MDEASADCRMALDTMPCSCDEENVHFAASMVYPRHFSGGVWNRGDTDEAIDHAAAVDTRHLLSSCLLNNRRTPYRPKRKLPL